MIRSIAFVCHEYPGDSAFGSEPANDAEPIMLAARALVGHGIAVHVITTDTKAKSPREIIDGVVVHRIQVHVDGSAPSSGLSHFYEQLDRAVDFEVVHCSDDVATSLPIRPGTIRHARVIDREISTADFLARVETQENQLRLPANLCSPRESRPRLGVIMLAYNALEFTKRAVLSLLHHTDVTMQLVVVNNASSDDTTAWLDSLEDTRVQPLHLPMNRGVCGGRNAGLDVLRDDADFVVFVDNDIEVLARWWVPFVEAFDTDCDVAIVGEEGAAVTWIGDGQARRTVIEDDATPCDVVSGFAMMIRPETMAAVGRFDERLGLFWHDTDDLSMRAARIGGRSVCVNSRRVVHFAHRSSNAVSEVWETPGVPSALADHNLRRIASKRERQALSPTTPFLLFADAREAIDNPDLLGCYGSTFTAEDEVALVLFGVGVEPLSYELELRSAAQRCDFDLEAGPKVIAICPPTASEDGIEIMADEVHAVLSAHRPLGSFSHLCWLSTDSPERVRLLAAKAWRARPRTLVSSGSTPS